MKRKSKNSPIDDLSIATIRSLCIDGINKAKSGHPGICLGAAPILYTLYKYYLNATPINSNWRNRDRFILSAGHGSMLLYSILHLCGYKVSLDDLKSFRQLDSLTPGHPEVGLTDGVDASSGPLGQGIGLAVGFAMAEEKLRNMYGEELFSHYTYALCGDGCLEEGISHEAITYAGFQRLNKLILLYDSNNVTLDGPLSDSNDDDVIKRFLAAKWDVIVVKNGNCVKDIKKAIEKAKRSVLSPTLIIVKTKIGFGSKNEGSSKTHGTPLGEEDGKFAKLSYGFDHDDFYIPEEVYTSFRENFNLRGENLYNEYLFKEEKYKENHSDLYEQLIKSESYDLSSFFPKEEFKVDLKEDSTRKGSQKVLNYFVNNMPMLMGGSADVAASVMTHLDNSVNFTYENNAGNNINFGIREFLMGDIISGMLLHKGLRVYGGCFLVFADYLKPALRMAALMHLPSIFLFSHDSIAVGEDGPTHQPVEQLAMLRSIPNVIVFRPFDDYEVYESYRYALSETNRPVCIILSRQNLPILNLKETSESASKGAYIVSNNRSKLDLTIIATGSEVSLALEVKKEFGNQYDIRIVSMLCMELFELNSDEYKESILGNDYSKRMSLEMSSTFGWGKYAKFNYGIDDFGVSAKASDAIKKYHFSKDDIIEYINKNIFKR